MDPITMLAIGSALYGGLSNIFSAQSTTAQANAITTETNAEEQQIFTEMNNQLSAEQNAPALIAQRNASESALGANNPNFNAAGTILQTPMSLGVK